MSDFLLKPAFERLWRSHFNLMHQVGPPKFELRMELKVENTVWSLNSISFFSFHNLSKLWTPAHQHRARWRNGTSILQKQIKLKVHSPHIYSHSCCFFVSPTNKNQGQPAKHHLLTKYFFLCVVCDSRLSNKHANIFKYAKIVIINFRLKASDKLKSR